MVRKFTNTINLSHNSSKWYQYIMLDSPKILLLVKCYCIKNDNCWWLVCFWSHIVCNLSCLRLFAQLIRISFYQNLKLELWMSFTGFINLSCFLRLFQTNPQTELLNLYTFQISNFSSFEEKKRGKSKLSQQSIRMQLNVTNSQFQYHKERIPTLNW